MCLRIAHQPFQRPPQLLGMKRQLLAHRKRCRAMVEAKGEKRHVISGKRVVRETVRTVKKPAGL